MEINDNEKNHENIIGTLKLLKSVSAPGDFEANLNRKINSENFNKEKKYLSGFFSWPKLLPSAFVTALAVLIFLVTKTSPPNLNNQPADKTQIKKETVITNTQAGGSIGNIIDKKSENKPVKLKLGPREQASAPPVNSRPIAVSSASKNAEINSGMISTARLGEVDSLKKKTENMHGNGKK